MLGLFSREKAEGHLGNVYTFLMEGSRLWSQTLLSESQEVMGTN